MATVLDREMFTEAEAARLLTVVQGTLHYWLEGRRYQGKVYRPVLRVEPTGKRTVTWAEFVEAGLLRQYRRHHHVPMAELRAFIDKMRDEFGVPYPLADRRPFAINKDLVVRAQAASGLDPEFHLVAAISGQLVLTAPSQKFYDRVDWEGDAAVGWRPDAEEESTVLIRPDTRFGRPAVKGISTAAIWEQSESGEDEADIASTFGLSEADVKWALAYELKQQAKTKTTRSAA